MGQLAGVAAEWALKWVAVVSGSTNTTNKMDAWANGLGALRKLDRTEKKAVLWWADLRHTSVHDLDAKRLTVQDARQLHQQVTTFVEKHRGALAAARF